MTLFSFAHQSPIAWRDVDGVTVVRVPADLPEEGASMLMRARDVVTNVLSVGLVSMAVSSASVAAENVVSSVPSYRLAGKCSLTAAKGEGSDALVKKLKAVRELVEAGHLDYVSNRASLKAAERVVSMLPAVAGDAQIGLDDDGNVFIHFVQGTLDAFLTVEPGALHLLIMQPGRPVERLDDVQFIGNALPKKVHNALRLLHA